MITLVLGGSGSGKSEYAESLVLKTEGKRYYVATMEPFGKEGVRRIERHRKLREKKEFFTVECYTHLELLELEQADVVLLECVSNVTANEMFCEAGRKENAVQRILDGIWKIAGQCRELIVVSNDVSFDTLDYREEMLAYISNLCTINRELAKQADRVIEIVCGIGIIRKGGEDDIN